MIVASFLLSLISFPLFVHGADVTNVTVETSRPVITPSYTVSPVAVGSDGLTTYIQQYEYSQELKYSFTTLGTTDNGSFRPTATVETAVTIDVPMQTIYATFAQGASRYKNSYGNTIPGGMIFEYESDCQWGEDRNGECVDKSSYGRKPSTPDTSDCTIGEDGVSSCIVSATAWFGDAEEKTFTRTWSGTFAPIYTLVVSGSISGQPASTTTSTDAGHESSTGISSATRQAAVGMAWSSFLLTTTCLFLINYSIYVFIAI